MILQFHMISLGQINENERIALIEFFEFTNGQYWDSPWDLSLNPDNWLGVVIEEGKVVEINLFNNNLSGTLPESIGNLLHLRVLNLGFNKISGLLPTTLGNLKHLRRLEIHMNGLKGEIGTWIGNLENLKIFNAYNNRFSGNLPESIGKLINLEVLNLSGNTLSGMVPASICKLHKLKKLGFFENQLSGTLPDNLNQLSQLDELVLSNNQFTGDIPSFEGLVNLEILQIQNNNFNSFEGLETIDKKQLLAFDSDAPHNESKFLNFEKVNTRMADTKFDDIDDNE